MKRLIIMEGPDGAGKTTLARQVRDALGDCDLIHHGPYPEIVSGGDLALIYRSSFQPAVTDYRHVVLDRCWISEQPYGLAFRDGADRLSGADYQWLETMARVADVHMYVCLPIWQRVLQNWAKRHGDEYLKTRDQLLTVYQWYRTHLNTTLPVTFLDPFDGKDHVKEMVNV